MWNRRRFLETVSGLPLLGGLAGSCGGAAAVRAEAVAMGAPDYFRELGVRPFINASGTYTAMTASLMPPEVMDAINYASKHYVMLEELQVKVGERIATLVHAEAAMVTSGAASALTLGTAAVLTGTDQREIAARIVAVDARIDPVTRNALVRARIEGRDAPAPGASVTVRVPVSRSVTAVAVPVSALRKGPGGDYVFVLAADSAGKTRAHLRPVQSGPVLGDEVVILAGLAAGERVAASGSFKLREAVLVNVVQGSR